MNFRQRLQKYKAIKFFSSVKLAVTCLVLLFILTFWGTIAQVHQGLYVAQERYFESFYFIVLGFFPFPGGQAVMWVLFLNLLCVALVRLVYKWRNIGIIIIHCGLLLFLISGYVVLRCAQESFVTLNEGQITNVSTAYHDWEISVWEETAGDSAQRYNREVTAISAEGLTAGKEIHFRELGMHLTVKD